MNCDRIAPFYELIERVAFGGRLQMHRELFLDAAEGKRSVLVLGDGDGRFTRALVTKYPATAVDSVDLSPGMILQARRRLRDFKNVKLVCADAFDFLKTPLPYDLVFTHFFIDCFETEQVQALVKQVKAALNPGGVWLISDFRYAPAGWGRVFTGLWLRAMYLFFSVTTGLQTNHLPDYETAITIGGFVKIREQTSFAGLIVSEWWKAPEAVNDQAHSPMQERP